MAGLPWIKVWTVIGNHPKVQRLEKAMGVQDALGLVIRLWCWTADYHPGGDIPKSDTGAMVSAATLQKVSRDREVYVTQALVTAGFLDPLDDGFRVHDWSEMQTAHLDADEKRKAQARERQRKHRASHNVTAVRDVTRDVTRDSVTERESRVDGDKTDTLSLTDEGARARADIIASVGPRPHPQLDATVAALREAGLAPVHPKPDMRAAVEAAIVKVGRDAAVQRIRDAWNPATPHLGWYLSEILGQAKKETGGKAKGKGMATPSKDWTSKEATEF